MVMYTDYIGSGIFQLLYDHDGPHHLIEHNLNKSYNLIVLKVDACVGVIINS
jgi:hypothetical protein